MSGIYIHIPFCHKACSYCNFHFSTSLRQKDDMVDAICKEISQRSNFFGEAPVRLSSIYLGGGTPSILQPSDLEQIMTSVHTHFDHIPEAEITLEANPEDINGSNLSAWRLLGINRLSVGLQSFHESELTLMNRNHTAQQSHKILSLIPDAGFDNYSIDLIFGVPDSDVSLWERNLDTIAQYNVPHLSCYGLTVEPRTKLYHDVGKGKIDLLANEIVADQFSTTHRRLSDLGYDHYEIASYAKPRKEAVHNSKYWRFEPYLGIGPSAHSYDGVQRWSNLANNAHYIKFINEGQSVSTPEHYSESDRYNEFIMFGWRRAKGIHLSDVAAFGATYLEDFERKMRQFDRSLFIANTDHYRLSLAGMLQSDHIIAEFFYG